ncbi:MAG: TetR/AcrR family transcriptional regulator [Blastocatellia bacterium]|nr:TetR/AcrR family transcriptional regulator [Blastocatellia bacterium]
MKKESTKNLLLETGLTLIAEQGFHHTGIDAVLKRAGVPKGSFYHYFASKEDFGLCLIERAATDYEARLKELLEDPHRTPLERFRRYFTEGRDQLAQQECRKGCLLGNLGQELADQSEPLRQRLAEVFGRWNQRLAGCLREAQAAGELDPAADVEELAAFCLAAYEGALLKAKVLKSPAPVDSLIKYLFERILTR